MAVKSADQISIVDLTDGYSVILTSDGYTFPGTTNAAVAGSCTTQIIAMRGTQTIPASVTLSSITAPTGITVTKDSNATSPTLTISASSSFTQAGVVTIPVSLEDGEITLNKNFSVSIAFTGATGSSGAAGTKWYTGTGITGTSTTAAVFSSSGVSSAAVGDMYLNTSTGYTYTCTAGGSASSAKWKYTGSIRGATGSTGAAGTAGAKWYSGTGITGTSTTAAVFSSSGVSSAAVGDMYLNTSTGYTYTCTAGGSASAATWKYVGSLKGATGATGAAGADAITMSITSSAGTIFKNSAVVTTLTAHVYKAGVEVTGSALSTLGTIRWYKDGSTTALSTTGATLTISAGDVTNKATYIAQLEA